MHKLFAATQLMLLTSSIALVSVISLLLYFIKIFLPVSLDMHVEVLWQLKTYSMKAEHIETNTLIISKSFYSRSIPFLRLFIPTTLS